MIEMSSGVIYGMFFLFLVLGALLGLRRGLTKSVIRIITVLVACVVVVFVVSPITSALLTTDISSAGLTIGELPVTNIKDTLIAYVGQSLGIGDLLSTSPTLVALISAIPAILVNLILFILLFFIAKGILYFVDIIINRVVIKKDSDKPKRRLWGALVGAVQGIICFLFCFIPIAGSMNVISDTLEVINSGTTGSATTANLTVVSANESTADESTEETLSQEEFTSQATSTIESYNDIFIIKMFNAVGYKAITNSVYDKLTTIEINKDTSTTLRNEAVTIGKIYNSYENLKDVDVSKFSEADQQNANQLIDDAFSSPIISGITTEFASGIADAWASADPTEFLGTAKPDFDPKLLESFDTLLLNLRTNTASDMQNDLKVLVATVKVSADHHLTENLNTGNTDLLISALGKDGCMEEVIATLASGKATKQILPSFIEFGLAYGYDAVGLNNTETNITKSANDVNWETESVILGNLFEGVSATYESTKQEGELLEKLDFVNFAKVLESIRASELLQGASQDITLKFLNSNFVVGIDVDSLINYIENDTTYKNMDFTLMLTTLKSSAEIASDIKDISDGLGDVSNLDNKDVNNLINGLTSDETSKQILKDLASEDNLKKSGADTATAGAVNVLVNSIADYDTSEEGAIQPPSTDEETTNASNAIQDLLIASKNAKSGDEEQQIFETKAEMESFIDNMLSSEFVWAVTIDKGVELGFKTQNETNLTQTEQEWLDEILEEKTTDGSCTEAQASALKEMFVPTV